MASDEGKLFVGGLSFDTNEQSLEQVFSKYGQISEGGGDRGYGGSRFESRSGGYGGSRDYYGSRSQGGGYGDRSSGGSYRDSYDSYATHNE